MQGRALTLVVCLLGLLTLSAQAAPWSFQTAEEYLFYSYAAYCPSDSLTNWSCKWCNEGLVKDFVPTGFPYDPKIDGYGFLGYHPVNKTIVVSFRGTTDLVNWITDLQSAIQVPYKNVTGAGVGKGFLKEWNDLLPQVVPAVQDLRKQYPDYAIWVTGHSLGAAISVLCALELSESGLDNVNVYNYGLPRVGNQAFANYYNQHIPNTYRVVNGHDIVPHVPLMSMGFYHVSTEVWENPAESLNFRVCNGGEDPNCSDSQLTDLSIYDHLHYLNFFESCAQ